MIDKIIKNLLLERNAEQVTYNTDEAIKEHKEQCDYLIELLKKQKTNGWIPCSERLPEKNEVVLCWVISTTIASGETYIIGSCHNKCWFLQTYEIGHHNFPVKDYVVVAWQPLPEPYRKGGSYDQDM